MSPYPFVDFTREIQTTRSVCGSCLRSSWWRGLLRRKQEGTLQVLSAADWSALSASMEVK